jgi:hypothetical protein
VRRYGEPTRWPHPLSGVRHLRRPCRLQKLKFRNYQPNDEELAKSKLDKIVVEDDEITQTELLAAAAEEDVEVRRGVVCGLRLWRATISQLRRWVLFES